MPRNKKSTFHEYQLKHKKSIIRKFFIKIFSKIARNSIFPQLRILFYKLSGISIGDKCFIGIECYIDDTFPELISIGKNSTISFRVIIVAHKEKANRGNTLTAPILIGENVFIGAGSIILPGVQIGNSSVVGAGAIVTKSVPADSVVTGNAATFKITSKI